MSLDTKERLCAEKCHMNRLCRASSGTLQRLTLFLPLNNRLSHPTTVDVRVLYLSFLNDADIVILLVDDYIY